MDTPISEYQPSKLLKPFVEKYWEGSFNTSKEQISLQMVPNGCIEIIIHLSDLHCNLLNTTYGWSQTPDYLILGLQTTPFEVKFTATVDVFAIRFKPEGIFNIFGLPSSMFVDSYEDLSLVLGKDFGDFCNLLREESTVNQMMTKTEEYLLRTLAQQRNDLNYVNNAAELIRKTPGIRIEDLCSEVSISQRQLERQFKSKIGISPKRYLRLVRINEVMNLLNQNHRLTLTSVAYHCGYSDQAHFIKDFKKIVGAKPTVFIRERERFISNAGLSHYSA